ncbi:high mobility group protein TDP-1 [Apis mellifera caucasica]|uniref:High mobility group protein homolog TDP-1 n=1 Tax=Apis mellifera TaxID=7460 RepID=A0A7M7ILR5_APIME|nr:high mobility group protein homolog TDP-1 [Apis mellifera]KAG6794334.1 high mobility group protein TDP-1 [Apis mellifera caucasica]KAG9429193.1 high mobility group protein TDP-1 [Apis mellifera carnica]|eukprot:XP_016771673.1 high mobility group protein homolog TDP-1 [Apis mellifera]
MGNTGSVQSSKSRKERKRESGDSADDRPGKNKRIVNGSESRTNGREKIKCRATNPFIIFFLRLRSKKPKEHVTVIARAAGKLWTQMSPEQRKKYIDLANAEKKRRQERKRKRKSRRK